MNANIFPDNQSKKLISLNRLSMVMNRDECYTKSTFKVILDVYLFI